MNLNKQGKKAQNNKEEAQEMRKTQPVDSALFAICRVNRRGIKTSLAADLYLPATNRKN